MQREDDPHQGPRPRGAEAWIPNMILAIVQLALVVALAVFVIEVRPLQGRIALPAWTIPTATTFCTLFAIYMILRAILNVRAAVRGYRESKDPPTGS
jgi:hypothetical protein